jgi:hypothetical protein
VFTGRPETWNFLLFAQAQVDTAVIPLRLAIKIFFGVFHLQERNEYKNVGILPTFLIAK